MSHQHPYQPYRPQQPPDAGASDPVVVVTVSAHTIGLGILIGSLYVAATSILVGLVIAAIVAVVEGF